MATHYPDQPEPVDSIEEEINRFFDRIVECVDYRRRTLIAEAREKREEKRARLVRKQESERQLLEAKVETEQNLKENLLKSIQEGILATLEEKLSEVRLQEAETRLVFQGDSGHLEEMILGLGEVLEQEIPTLPRYQDLRVTVAVGNQGNEVLGEGLGDEEIHGPKAIAINEKTNNIYIAQPLNFSIYSQTGVFLKIFKSPQSGFTEEIEGPLGIVKKKRPIKLCGIAIHGNYIYVTSSWTDRVYQYIEETDIRLVTNVGGFGSKHGKFNYPSQVCVSSNGDVYVADCRNNRIQIFNSSLHFLRSICLPYLTYPLDIKLTQDKIYVLSNINSPCIHLFSYTGEQIRSLITRGEGNHVKRAYYFCLDANKNIIISDCWAHCVKVFSNEGTLLHTISGRGHEKGMLVRPQGIALTKDHKLVVVSNNENYGLQIFSC